MSKSINILFILIACLAGFAGAQEQNDAETDPVSVYVVSHGWHTGIIVPASVLNDSLFIQLNEYPDSEYLEFGWGDYAFYKNPDVDYFLAAKAALWPTKAALHIVQITDSVNTYFPYSDLIELTLTLAKCRAVVRYIKDSFALNDSSLVIRLDKGLYRKSGFYLSREKYFFPKTCNVWTARALRKGGIPVKPLSHQRAGPLMQTLAEYGKVIRLSDD